MVLPVALLLAVFLIGLANGLLESVGIVPAVGLNRFTLSYYQDVFTNVNLKTSFLLSLYISLVSSVLAVVLGVVISGAAVSTGLIKSRMFQIINIPVIVPHTVSALLMINMFSQSGIIARIAYRLQLIQGQEGFLPLIFDERAVGVILAYLWKEIPFVVLVTAAIMGNINLSLGEAALNLGASKWQVFRKITLPLCLPSIMTSFIIVFAFSFGAYEVPYLLGVTEPKALPVRAYVEYTHPDLAHRPYAMVLNSIMIFLSVLITYFYHKILSRNLIKTGSGVQHG
jgi:putative spermidine/putrescine transport system permease protein